ncbi:hypothetical protein MBM_02178 [Drepanopeziza brunnea f. sp. 'multigermtubi' MB_m1]|uniref:Uncharacterized protein n=1 Tax=Marssonina brunnea f. sp. multigermtubi (strain MB_m1) TaxID=1072389 RepID=K1X4Y2_MARBU|nr:uncharacterized protein MBM_02178 [Drepanopeziza brunnea f. sp. 'multigermtubi' MB_m1]EKD20226.1 hypothetical protein MBM_02178 [Drepanopeziza brunnea f. sp. 'multigermtubi' MB_m1]
MSRPTDYHLEAESVSTLESTLVDRIKLRKSRITKPQRHDICKSAIQKDGRLARYHIRSDLRYHVAFTKLIFLALAFGNWKKTLVKLVGFEREAARAERGLEEVDRGRIANRKYFYVVDLDIVDLPLLESTGTSIQLSHYKSRRAIFLHVESHLLVFYNPKRY